MIRVPQVRLVAADGKQLGLVDTKEALREAEKAGLDLVEVAPNAKPPVCRIMDYGKYKYLMSKKAHESKKKQTVIHVKEVKFRVKTEEHDFQVKKELGLGKLKRVEEALREVGTIEQHPKLEGRNMTMVIAPIHHK
jgi:translation initiation factor IF-3